MSRMLRGTFGVAVIRALIATIGHSKIDAGPPHLPAATRAAGDGGVWHERRARPADAADRKELRAYARRQAGCKALIRHHGIGELTAVTIWPSCATARGPHPRAKCFATPGWT